MRKEELLRQLEERLARGEISEETYQEIRERYDAMPAEREPDDEARPPEGQKEVAEKDIQTVVQETIEAVLEQVGQKLEATFGSEEFEQRMGDVGQRVKEAFANLGPRVEAKGRRIVISGAGVVSSDTPIDQFKCSGAGKVTSDLRAKEVRVSGACKIEGSCECQEFRSSGSVKVESDLLAQEFRSSGSARILSNLRTQELTTSGSLTVGRSILDAQEVIVMGRLVVEEWVRTQQFTSRGRFRIGKGIEAQEVDIHLSDKSRVPTIKALRISVRRGKRSGDLKADTIEGQDVYLESTRARLVQAKNVRIGPFCTIDTVEAEELEIHETSTVKEQRRRTDSDDGGRA
ncbi:MAG: hypothetical protein ACE5HJ_07345 [Thermoplasmata archaeon]